MALSTPTTLGTLSDGSAAKSVYTTASLAPSANSLIVVTMTTDPDSGAAVSTPTMTTTLANVGTWTWISQLNFNSGTTGGVLWVGWAKITGTPGTGTLTFTFADPRDNFIATIYGLTGHDTTTPIAQSAKNTTMSSTAGLATFSATPAATSLILIAASQFQGANSAVPITQKSGFTELHDLFQWNSTYGFGEQHEVAYLNGSGTTNVSATYGATTESIIIGVEIAAAGTGTGASAAWTEGDDTIAVAAAQTIGATAAWTEGDDTWAVAATATSSGVTVAWTEDDDTWAVAGVAGYVASVAWTEGDDTIAANASGGQTDVLFDDFSGTRLDGTKWVPYDRLGDAVNAEVDAVKFGNVRVSGGQLLIDLKFEDVLAGDTTTGPPNPTTVHYTSGQIAQSTVPFLYGDIRVRAKMPGGTGAWPCIWMLGDNWQASQPYTANVAGANWPAEHWWEIDIAEFMFDHRTVVNNALHYITASRTGSGEKALPFDATSRFMVYRLLWTPTTLTWYVDAEDGNGWVTLTSMSGVAGVDIPNSPGYLIIHSAIGGQVANTPVSGTFPQTLTVDYAQVQRTANTVASTALTASWIEDDDTWAVNAGAPVTVAWTEDDDTVAAAAAQTIGSTTAWTEADDTIAVAAAQTLAATASWTEDDDTWAATALGGTIGSVAWTDDDDTIVAAASQTVGATASWTEDDDTWVATGLGGAVAAVSWTEGDDTVAATAVETTPATVSWTEDDDTWAIAASNIPTGSMSVVWTEDDDTWAAAASQSISTTAAWTEDDDTVAAAASMSTTASASWTEDDDTWSITATNIPSGTVAVSWTEDDDIAVAVASQTISISSTWTEDDDTWSATAINAGPSSTTISWSEDDDAWSATAGETLTASVGWTETSDTWSVVSYIDTGTAPATVRLTIDAPRSTMTITAP